MNTTSNIFVLFDLLRNLSLREQKIAVVKALEQPPVKKLKRRVIGTKTKTFHVM